MASGQRSRRIVEVSVPRVHHKALLTEMPMTTFLAIFWMAVAIVMLVILPIMFVKTTIDYFRGRGSQRRGSGGISSGIAGAMQELDRIITRPSAEHKIEAETPVLKREDDGGND